MVAIHISELTQALQEMPASPPTPTGQGTTGYEWWVPSWRYFVGYESLKEALRSDGTPFVEVSDAQIAAGVLTNGDGSPRYPIVFSLASEAVSTAQIVALESYVSGGGFLFVGSSAFTRNPDGTTRGDFALADPMGLHMAVAGLENWYENSSFTKVGNHRLTSHIPSGELIWRAPLEAKEISTGVSPNHAFHSYHYVWGVTTGGAQTLANGNNGPILAVKDFGQGWFIYNGLMQSLLGHGGGDAGMYSYLIYRNAIEWAFESANVPIIKVSPWQYQYDAAFIVRHDFENFQNMIRSIEASAAFEHSLGAKGDYYFCTGTLREHMADKNTVISSLRRAVSNYGATIGSHNGGLKNPVNLSLSPYDYDYWHWGPDEALDVTPAGYPSGKAYAEASIETSFLDVEEWLTGLDNGRSGCGATGDCPRTWVSPCFNSTREDSYDILQQLGVATTGEQKISPFPHWTVSYDVPGKRFSNISLPVNDWFIGNDIAQTLDFHNSSSMRAAVNFYYDLGTLINFYSHTSSDSGLQNEYVEYVVSKPKVWATNSVGIYDWWSIRSSVALSPTFNQAESSFVASASITGITHADTAVEIAIPNWNGGQDYTVQVKFNGNPADPSNYRITSYGLKCRPGVGTSYIEVRYAVNQPPSAVNDSYTTSQSTLLTVPAPGVLGNDTDPEGTSLTAQLDSTVSHGSLTLNANGSFTYTPTTGYTGTDSFTYRASDGNLTSDIATVTITISAVNQPPSAVNDSYTTSQSTLLTVPAPGVLGNDTDPEGTSLTAQLVSTVSHGSLTLNANGSFTYTPTTGYTGTDSFTYRASDGNLTSDIATVTITISAVNQPPSAVNDSYAASQSTLLTVPAPGVLGNDTDPEGTALSAQLDSTVSHGSLTLNANGSFTYTPMTGYTGTDSFTYRASDGNLTSDIATVTISVNEVTQVIILSPADGEIVPSGEPYQVSWEAPFNAVSFKLFYSLDNGKIWNRMKVSEIDEGNKKAVWTVPDFKKNKANCLVKVKAFDSTKKLVGAGISGSPFSIESVRLTSPVGGEVFELGDDIVITWNTFVTLNQAGRVRLLYKIKGGLQWKVIGNIEAGNPETYTWKPPKAVKYKVRIVLKDGEGRAIGQDTTPDYFTISP